MAGGRGSDSDSGWQTQSGSDEPGTSDGDPVPEEEEAVRLQRRRRRTDSNRRQQKGARRKPDGKTNGCAAEGGGGDASGEDGGGGKDSGSDDEPKTWDPTDPWQEPEPKYTRRDGFVNFVQARVGLARRRHAHKAAKVDREDAAVLIQRVVRARADRKKDGGASSKARMATAAAAVAELQQGEWPRLWQVLAKSERLQPVRRWLNKARVIVLGSAPLEANVDHFHRAILRYMSFLFTLLLTALFTRPTKLHAVVNAVQCSAAATAAHAVCAKVFKRIEQMQNPFYLRRAKKIRSIKKRHTIMSCYGWVATVVEGAANVACFFGTYLVLIYWLKFDEQPGMQYHWLYAATLGSVINGVVWGRARRSCPCFQPSKRRRSAAAEANPPPPSPPQRGGIRARLSSWWQRLITANGGEGFYLAELYFVIFLLVVAWATLNYIYRFLPPPEGGWGEHLRAARRAKASQQEAATAFRERLSKAFQGPGGTTQE